MRAEDNWPIGRAGYQYASRDTVCFRLHAQTCHIRLRTRVESNSPGDGADTA